MFPFNEEPISVLRTSRDIEHFGHQALLRALNINRVVAFVGSGASYKFAQPTWGSLAETGYTLFFALENAIIALDEWGLDKQALEKRGVTDQNLEAHGLDRKDFEKPLCKDFRQALSPLVAEIKDLHSGDNLAVPHKVELIEDYFSIVTSVLERNGIKADDLNKNAPLQNWEDAIKKTPGFSYTSGEPSDDIKRYFGSKPDQSDPKTNFAISLRDFRRIFADGFKSVQPDNGKLKTEKTFADLKPFTLHNSNAVDALDKDRADITKIDGARTLRRRLGIRRFLTLNYDLELELMLFEEGRATPLDSHKAFEDFVLQNAAVETANPGNELGRAVVLQGPSGRVIRSTSSRSETLADLFSFGAFPTNYDATVHHLHGRLDDPENMIVTPKDYQRIYYGASEQKKSFDEARHAVFTGSDILVLGLGTSENDVLKPLRDFLELEEDRRDTHGKVYYLTSTEFSGKEASFTEAYKKARLTAMAKTQTNYKDYGMHTLFVDFSLDAGRTRMWTSQNVSCFAMRAEIAYYRRQIEDGQPITRWNDQTIKNELEAVLGGVWLDKGQHPLTGTGNYERLKYLPNQTIVAARDIIDEWHRTPSSGGPDKNSYIAALRKLDSHLRDVSLVNFAKHLEASRKTWWEDWSQFPGMRIAALGPHRYKMKGQTDTGDIEFEVETEKLTREMVWKQANLPAHFLLHNATLGNPEQLPQFTSLLVASSKARRAAQKRASKLEKNYDEGKAKRKDKIDRRLRHYPIVRPASIARVSVSPGGGKGRLLAYLTSQTKTGNGAEFWPFQTLFHYRHSQKNWSPAEPNRNYKACFMSHLTFALEFSGTMIAFSRMVQQLLPEFRREVAQNDARDKTSYATDPRWVELLEHQFHQRTGAVLALKTLGDMFALLQDTCPKLGWRTRMVGIFSYLDRLVNDDGDAYSPMHREFFRLISGWDNKDEHMRLPIDFVFINCFSNQPIRYLSHEVSLTGAKQSRREKRWRNGHWNLRHDRGVALQHWTALDRVRPRVIFLEALGAFANMNVGEPRQGTKAQNTPKELADVLGIKFDVGVVDAVDEDFLHLPRSLKKFMYRRVAHGYYIAGLAHTIWYKKGYDKAEFLTEWNRCISALDIAYAREKSRGLVDELLGIYRRLDREVAHPGNHYYDQRGKSRFNTTEISRVMERLRTMMIDHLALLQVPITAQTLLACPDVNRVAKRAAKAEKARREAEGKTLIRSDLEIVTEELNHLVARGLATRYEKFSDKLANKTPWTYVYVLNSRIAGILRARANLEVYSQYKLMVFQPNAYPSQPERALKPEIHHFDRVSGIVRALVKDIHTSLVPKYWDMRFGKFSGEDDATFAAEMEKYNDKLRAAYALIRGTFSISVIARLAEHVDLKRQSVPFDEYRVWTRKLLNTATLLHEIRKLDMRSRIDRASERNEQVDVLPYNHPFLRDEISWLYNERALVSFVQGRLFDALPLFEQAQVMLGRSPDRSAPTNFGATHRRVQMNYALAQIERGNIVVAQDTLTRIVSETGKRWDSDTPAVMHCMADGYLALCYHLTNEFARAQAGYERVLANIGQFNHPRAESIFRRHYADLLRIMATSRNDPEYKEAITNLRSSEELALGIRATDLHHYAMVAQAKLDRDMQERGQALENLRAVEKYARAMGVQKMLSDVLKVRGEVLLAEGETTQAGFVTAQSIAISKRNGMRLRKISAAIIQARILRAREQTRDANRLLEQTIMESQALGYATKTSQAISLLQPEFATW